MNSFFKKIAESKASGSGKNFVPGGYDLVVRKMFLHEGHGGTMFITNFKILKSWETADGKPHAAGGDVDFVVNLSNVNAQGSQFANVKRFILALFGYSEDEVSQDDFIKTLEELCGEAGEKAQPMRGARITAEVWNKPQKKDPTKSFTNHRWTHVPMSAADLEASRKVLDAADKAAA